MLRVCKNADLTEQGVGVGDVIVPGTRDDGPPATAGDVGIAHVVPDSVAPEEKGDAERPPGRQINRELRGQFFQVGRVESESQSVFFRDEEVGFQGVPDKGDAGVEDLPAELIDVAVPRVERLHLLPCLFPQAVELGFPVRQIGIETGPEKAGQPEAHVWMGVESPHHVLEPVPLRLTVGQGRVAESDEGVYERGVLTAYDPVAKKGGIGRRARRQHLGVVQLPLDRFESRHVPLQELTRAGGAVEAAEKIGKGPFSDDQAVETVDTEIESV